MHIWYNTSDKRKGDKKMFEELMLRMIEIYGFENEITIQFCELCEKHTFDFQTLETLVRAHEANPVY